MEAAARERARAFIAAKRRALERAREDAARAREDLARAEEERAALGGRGTKPKASHTLAGQGPNRGGVMWRARATLRRHGCALAAGEIVRAMGAEPTAKAKHAPRSAMYKHPAAGTTFVRVARGRCAARESEREARRDAVRGARRGRATSGARRMTASKGERHARDGGRRR